MDPDTGGPFLCGSGILVFRGSLGVDPIDVEQGCCQIRKV